MRQRGASNIKCQKWTRWSARILVLFALFAVGFASDDTEKVSASMEPTALSSPQEMFSPLGEQSTPSGEPTDWYWWWFYNKDRYLQLRTQIFESAPTTGGLGFFLGEGVKVRKKDPAKLSAYELRVLIVPALLGALEPEDEGGDPNVAIVGATLRALAKVGARGELSDGDSFDEIIGDFLDDDTKGIRTTAVYSLGILGYEDSIPTLIELLRDSKAGRDIVDRVEVSRQVRAAAAYALGMIGARSKNVDVCRGIIGDLGAILDGVKFATRDIKTACITAMGLLPLQVEAWTPAERWRGGPRPLPPDPSISRLTQIRYLLKYMGNTRTNHDYIRSQAPIAIMRLIEGANEETKTEVKDACIRILRKHTREPNEVQMSAAIALGVLGDADSDKQDRKIVDTLIRYVDIGDSQSRRFALMALGQIAGRPGAGENSFWNQASIMKFLRRYMEGRGESRVRPWAAMSLGVMMNRLLELNLPIPEKPLKSMRKAFDDCLTPLDVGAFALALGLAKDYESLERLEDKLQRFELDTPRGLILLSMGMIGNEDAEDRLLEELRDLKFRAERMAFTSIALALTGTEERVPILTGLLEDANSQASHGPIIASLGVAGDRRVIPTLSEVVRDEDTYTFRVRSAAIVGLGNVADKDSILWRAQFTENVNWVFAPPTYAGLFTQF